MLMARDDSIEPGRKNGDECMKKFLLLGAALIFGLMTCALSQTQNSSQPAAPKSNLRATDSMLATAPMRIVPGSRVYIEKMNGFENYLAAAFSKKKVQLVPVADEEQADYVITGTSEDKKAGWAKIVFMGNIHSDNAASITMVDKKTSAIVFAYAVNKKSTVHGDQTTAEACAKHLEAHIEGRE